MDKLFPSYKKFSRYNDWYRLKINKKPRNPKWLKVTYYPFALIGLCLLYGAFFWLIVMVRSSNRTSYRTSDKYRKVIKEGILFDTVEYHEK